LGLSVPLGHLLTTSGIGFLPIPSVAFHETSFMLGDYKVSRCTRRCHSLDRPLREGELYYSVVLSDDEQFERHDYSAESWQGPPEGTIGWWKNRMPTADQKKMVLAPPEVLIDLLRQMEKFPDRAKSRYLLGLMLMRRKLVRPAKANQDNNSEPIDPAKTFTVEVVADGSTIDIPVCTIGRSESDSLRDQLNELLYCESEPDPDDE